MSFVEPINQYEKLPPHSIESEKCLLASLMLDAELLGEVINKIRRNSFYLADHQVIFDAIVRMNNDSKPIDAITLREQLIKQGVFEEVGGSAYLGELLSTVPSAANGKYYADIVADKYTLRELIAASNAVIQDAYSPHDAVSEIVDRAEKRIFDISEQKIGSDATSLGEIAMSVYESLESGGQRGLPTGFYELDEMLNGLHGGEMVIIAARPSMGKTAIAMNIIEGVSRSRQPCAVFSLEMGKQALAQRLMCSRTGINSQKVRKGMLSKDEFARMAQMVNEVNEMPIFIDDQPGLTVMELRAKARRLKQQHDISCMMIDYMQLMDAPGDNRQQQVSEISRGIKSVARELDIPVLALSQLNRASEGREGHRPRMSDLRESGSIEQDADVIMLLHREDYYKQTEPDYAPDNIAEIIIAKQRNGPTGVVKLFFDNNTTSFKNLSEASNPF